MSAALRAFPPALCVPARVGGNAGTRAVPCACARRRDGAPCRESGWALLLVAQSRPAPNRHFVLERAGPPHDGRPEAGTTKAPAQGLLVLLIFPLLARRRWRPDAETTSEYWEKWALSPHPSIRVGARAGSRRGGRGGMHGLVCAQPWGVHLATCAQSRASAHAPVCPNLCVHHLTCTNRWISTCLLCAASRGCFHPSMRTIVFAPTGCLHRSVYVRTRVYMNPRCAQVRGFVNLVCAANCPGLCADPRVQPQLPAFWSSREHDHVSGLFWILLTLLSLHAKHNHLPTTLCYS